MLACVTTVLSIQAPFYPVTDKLISKEECTIISTENLFLNSSLIKNAKVRKLSILNLGHD